MYITLSKTIKKCVKKNSDRPIENLLAKLNTGKLFLTPMGDVSKPHPTNLSNGCGETVLHFAAKNGYLNVCKLIAENIQEKNPKDFWEKTPLQRAEENDQYSVVEYFQKLLDIPLTRKSCPYCFGFRCKGPNVHPLHLLYTQVGIRVVLQPNTG